MRQRHTGLPPGLPASAYRSGLKRCAQTGEWRVALQLLERLAATGERGEALRPHSPSYANAMLACRRGGAWPVALRLLSELLEAGGRLDAFVASNAIAACEPAGRWEQALAILRALEETESPNTVSVNAAISVCASGGRWREAMSLLHAMEHPNARSFSATIAACNRGGAWAVALELFEALEPEWQDSVCYGAAIAAAAGRGSWLQAISLLGRMREARLVVELPALNAALHACAKAARWQDALQLLHEMRAGDGVQPNKISYNAALAACSRCRQWRSALYLLHTMRRRGVKPDVVSCGTAIVACERAGEWRMALSLLNLMEQPWRGGQQRRREKWPRADLGCYRAVINAVGRGAGWRASLALLQRMGGVGRLPRDARTYGPVIMAAARERRVGEALRLTEEAEAAGLQLDEHAASAVLGACARAGQWEAALATLERMGSPGVASYTAVAAACGRARQWEQSLQLLPRMCAAGLTPDMRAMSTVAWAAGRGPGWAQALELLWDMRKASEPPMAAADFYTMALGASERLEAVVALLRMMRAEGFSPEPLSFYTAALEGWQGGAGRKPQQLACAILRSVAEGGLPPESDVRVWNLLCRTALLRQGNGKASGRSATAAKAGGGTGDASRRTVEVEEAKEAEAAEELLDAAYGVAVAEGSLTHWTASSPRLQQAEIAGLGRQRRSAAVAEAERVLAPHGAVLAVVEHSAADSGAAYAIDLHGFSVPLARAAVRHVLREVREAVQRGATLRPLILITGTGSTRVATSEGPSPLRRAVTQMLKDASLNPRLVRRNDGRLRVSAVSLEIWAAAQAASGKEGGNDVRSFAQ